MERAQKGREPHWKYVDYHKALEFRYEGNRGHHKANSAPTGRYLSWEDGGKPSDRRGKDL